MHLRTKRETQGEASQWNVSVNKNNVPLKVKIVNSDVKIAQLVEYATTATRPEFERRTRHFLLLESWKFHEL